MNILLFLTLLKANILINIGDPKFVKPNFAYYTTCNLSTCSKVIEIVKNDLDYSNILTFVPLDNYPETKAYNNLNAWKSSATKYLLKLEHKNSYFNVFLYDVDTNATINNFRSAILKTPELTAREISSRVYNILTGKKAIFNTKIAFIGTKDKRKNLFIMDYDGKNIKQITFFKSIIVSPAWSPCNNFISYSRYRTMKKNNLMTTSLDLFIYDLKENKETAIVSGYSSSGSSWSKDGENIVFTSNIKGDPDLFLYNIKTKRIVELIIQRGIDVEASFSNDNKKIVYSSSKFGNPHIFTYELDTKKETRLTFTGKYNSSPAWSPTANSIVFAALDDPFNEKKSLFDIFLINPYNIKDVQRLTIASGNNENPSWSPDGRHLVYTSTRNGGSDIYFINEDGTNERSLTSGILSYSPTWSNFFD